MDHEEKRKRQLRRVIIAEAGMVVSVVAIVVVAIMLAMGFFISGDGQIEQSGLMQIHSLPTGATVELDDTTLFSRTNLSRTMSPGQHHLRISKDGYDSWENDIEMYSGVLIRLYYPRLFLQNRQVEKVMKLGDSVKSMGDLEFYSVSQGRGYALYAEKGSSEWHLVNLRADTPKDVVVDVSGILPGVVEQEGEDGSSTDAAKAKIQKTGDIDGVAVMDVAPRYRFEGKVKELRWSENEEKVIVTVNYQNHDEWVLVNLRDVAGSLNLTKTFGLDFSQIEIIDGAANRLFALENQHLRRINTADKSISRVLLEGVESFSHFEDKLAYVAKGKTSEGKLVQEIGIYHDGDEGGIVVATAQDGRKVRAVLSRYYDEEYIAYIVDNKLTVKYGSLPTYRKESVDLTGLKDLVTERELASVPEYVDLSAGGEYLVARTGRKFMVTDFDMGEYYEYEAPTEGLDWLDDSMMYAVLGGSIEVWDFDGANKRNLAESVDGGQAAMGSVSISENNRWMYYLMMDDGLVALARERIRD